MLGLALPAPDRSSTAVYSHSPGLLCAGLLVKDELVQPWLRLVGPQVGVRVLWSIYPIILSRRCRGCVKPRVVLFPGLETPTTGEMHPECEGVTARGGGCSMHSLLGGLGGTSQLPGIVNSTCKVE